MTYISATDYKTKEGIKQWAEYAVNEMRHVVVVVPDGLVICGEPLVDQCGFMQLKFRQVGGGLGKRIFSLNKTCSIPFRPHLNVLE